MALAEINRNRGDTKKLVMKLPQNKTIFPLSSISAVLDVDTGKTRSKIIVILIPWQLLTLFLRC